MKKELWSSIKCPYCFHEFAHDEVHFRIAEEACEYAKKKLEKEHSEDEKFSKFLKKEEKDPKYETIWGEFRGGMPSESIDSLFYVPWVDSGNKSDMIVDDYVKDNDGFVEKIEDECGHFESRIRICPHCHNKLPLHYGKNPQKFISIFGIPGSGKTVFIKQLLAKIADSLENGILSHVNGSYVNLTLPDDDASYITLNQPLPDSTKTVNLKVPYFATMSFRRGKVLTTYDFVIYDIAGEILVDLARNDLNNKFRFFSRYIEHSDAMIVLIDPMQLINNPMPKYPASEMITTLHKVFGGVVKVPTAITISKSDLMLSNNLVKNNLNPNDEFFNTNSIINKAIPWDPAKKYFYMDEYSNLKAQLGRFYGQKAGSFNQNVQQQIENSSFFAVSALVDGVDQKLTFELSFKEECTSEHIEECIEKFAILSKKLKYIQEDIKEQEAYPDEQIIDTNNINANRAFIFDQNEEVVRKLNEILGNLSMLTTRSEIREAIYEQFEEEETIELREKNNHGIESLSTRDLIKYIYYTKDKDKDYSFSIYMQGYPRRNGNLKSLRIEEPFFWLLSELDIIDHGELHENEHGRNQSSKNRLFSWRKA